MTDATSARLRPLADTSPSAVVAGFVAMLVGVTSSIVVVFQAAQALGADAAQVTSWIWATCVGTGLTSLGLSLWYRRPVLTAWSTPGAAMLVSAAAGVTLPEALGWQITDLRAWPARKDATQLKTDRKEIEALLHTS